MKRLNSILAILMIVVFLGACSDDKDDTGTNPVDETFSFPLASGNSWTYDVYELDENENKTDVKVGTNKIIIGEAVTLDGRAGFNYSEESTPDDGDEDEPNISAMSSDADGLYIYFNNFTEEVGNPLEGITPGWTKVIDFKNQTWESFNFPIDITEEGSTSKGFLKMAGSRIGNIDVTYKGKSYSAVKFKSTMTADITATIEGVGSYNYKVEDDSYYVIISGIGMFEVKSVETDEETEIKGGDIEMLIDHTVN